MTGSRPDPRHVLRYAARSDRGLIRATNQDSVFAGNRLLVIADGMGGHAAGDTASRLVVAAFAPLNAHPPAADLLAELLSATRDGNDAIAETVADNPDLDGMGTTLTAMLFDGDRVGLAHVGDSRAYLYRSGVLHQLTHDDTFVQSLVDDGRITEAEASHHPQRNLLLRALNGSELDPSLALREVRAGDRYLLCSDGLHGVVGAEPIADTLADPDPERAADTLIQRALLRGGPDNVTVIVADVIDTGVVPAPGPVTVAGAEPADPDATGPIQQLTREMPRVPLPPIPEEPGAPAEFLPDFEDDGDELDTEDSGDDGDGRGEDEDAGDDGDDSDGSDGDGSDAGAGGDGNAGDGNTHGPGGAEGRQEGHDPDGSDVEGPPPRGGRGPAGTGRPGAKGGPGKGAPATGERAGTRRAEGERAQRRRWHRRGALALAIAALVLVAIGGSTLWVRSQYYVGANGDTVAVFRGVNGSLLGLSFASVQEDSCAGRSDCTPIKMDDLQPAARNQVLAGIPAASLADARGVMARLSGQLLPPCPSPNGAGGPASGSSPAPGSSSAASSSGGAASLSSPASGGTASGGAASGGAVGTSLTGGAAGGQFGTDGATAAGAGATGTGSPTTATSTAPTTATPTGHPPVSGRSGGSHVAGHAAGPAGITGSTGRTGTATTSGTAITSPPAGNPERTAAHRVVVTVQPTPVTSTVLTTVTASPAGLAGSALGQALLPATTHRSPTTTGEPTTTVTASTPTVTVTQTVTAPPTVTGTPLAPAPAVPGVSCRVVP